MTDPVDQDPKPQRIIRFKEVKDRVSLSTSSIYEMMAKGEFPRPIMLGVKSRGWIESEIEEFINSKIRARDETGVTKVRAPVRKRKGVN